MTPDMTTTTTITTTPTVREKKVAILGFAPHYIEAPFTDESFEIWGVNQLHQFIPRATRWFELHPWHVVLAEHAAEQKDAPHGVTHHIDWLRQFTGPTYMIEAHPVEIPNSVAYPLDEMVQMFFPWARKNAQGRWADAYFRCSASYMLALAIAEGFTEIHMYGVDMAQSVEYREQRPSCEYMLGFAAGRGIKIHTPHRSNLLRTAFLYGYDDEAARGFAADCQKRKEFMQQQINNHQAQITAAQTAIHQYSGAMQDIDYMIQTHGG